MYCWNHQYVKYEHLCTVCPICTQPCFAWHGEKVQWVTWHRGTDIIKSLADSMDKPRVSHPPTPPHFSQCFRVSLQTTQPCYSSDQSKKKEYSLEKTLILAVSAVTITQGCMKVTRGWLFSNYSFVVLLKSFVFVIPLKFFHIFMKYLLVTFMS